MAYIDGFAVYHGLRSKGWRRFYWLDYRVLIDPGCDHRWDRPKEKMTDVNIALSMVLDALDDVYDTALLVAADADLVPAVRAVQQRAGKQVIVISPPGRRSDELRSAGNAALHFRSSLLNKSQLPDVVADGAIELRRPGSWT